MKILEKYSYVIVFVFSFLIGLLVLYKRHVTPFGGESLAVFDAHIQYLDFFSYYKNILSGNDHIGYSFNKFLGGNTFAIFTYYLASPINLLIYFFDKNELGEFFSLVYLFKVSLSALFMSIFLRYRFSNLPFYINFILSLGYSFSQYNISQASNIMWLDGVYLLPLNMLGVFFIVEKRRVDLLAISISCAMLFNWYTGIINCLFSAFWLILELFHKKNYELKTLLITLIRYSFGMLIGILISCIYFIPTYLELGNGKGSIDFSIFNTDIVSNVFSLITSLLPVYNSSFGNPSLYVGLFSLLIILSFTLTKSEVKGRLEYFYILLIAIFIFLLFYWRPFIFLFSILKYVGSYWYRYGYLGSFMIIYLTAYVILNNRIEFSTLFKNVLVFFILLFGVFYLRNDLNVSLLYKSFFFVMLYFFIFYAIERIEPKKIKKIFYILFVLAVSYEFIYFSSKAINTTDNANYKNYIDKNISLINNLKGKDQSFFRILDLVDRGRQSNFITANYNEGLAFGYKTIRSYTSSPNKNQLEFFSSLGYPAYEWTMNAINYPILPVDAFFNVKYLISDRDFYDKELILNSSESNKRVYVNEYLLPLFFNITDRKDTNFDSNEPFDNINKLYSYLVGRDVKILNKLDIKKYADNGSIYVTYESSAEPYIKYYFYLDTNNQSEEASLFLNNDLLTKYTGWLSPRVIPVKFKRGLNELRLDRDLGIKNAQLVGINLNSFRNIIDELKEKSSNIQNILIKDGYIKLDVINGMTPYLVTSIPFDTGWDIYINGEKVQYDHVFGMLMRIPLYENVTNHIEMKYTIPGFKVGGLLSFLGIIILIFWYVINYVNRKGNKVC